MYEVRVPVRGYSVYEIIANSPLEAKEIVLFGVEDAARDELDEDLDTNNWKINLTN